MLIIICIGCTIYILSLRCAQISYVRFFLALLLGGVINLWTIMRAIQSCENIKERDYSDAFEVLLGKKAANVLNVFISQFSLGHLMKYSCLMLALVRKFVMGIAFR